MDWSAVYENHGEEEGHWEDHGETRSSRVAHRLIHSRTRTLSLPCSGRSQARHDDDHGAPHSWYGAVAVAGTPTVVTVGTASDGDDEGAGRYSPLVAYAFTVNYILGVGSLGIPYAFYRAGLILGNAMIVFVTVLSYWTVLWVSETVARARRVSPTAIQEKEKTHLVVETFEDFPEVTWLCDRFLGRIGSRLYQLSLLGLMYGGLLGYSQVFVNALLAQVTHIGSLELTSLHAAVIFGLLVIPLSCSDLTEQIAVQLAMSVVRFVALLIMIVSATYAIAADPYDAGPGRTFGTTAKAAPYLSDVPLADLAGFGVMFSTGVFSQLFQHSVPGLLAPLGPRNQPHAPAIFGSTLVTTMFFYIALGTVSALYFGSDVASSVNLNWADFTWGLAPTVNLVPWWASFMSMVVVVFPALDTLSVYPLISVTLGDNMAAVVPKNWVRAIGGRGFWKMVCRLSACLPPLIISIFSSDLSLTLQFSGLAGIYVAFFAPALLQLRASAESPAPTVYSSRFSGPQYAYGVIGFGVFALVVLLYQLSQEVFASSSPGSA